MTDLKQLAKNLAQTQALAKTDLEVVPYQTRASITSMVRDAQERLEKLRTEYSARIRASSVGLFVFGEPVRVAAFTEIAAAEAGVILIQGDDLYQRLASRVAPTLGASHEFGPTQLGVLHLALSDLMKAMDIRRMEMPRLQELVATPDRVSLVAYIRKLVQASVGHELLRLVVDRAINDKALAEMFAGKVLPVAVVGLAPEEVSALAQLFTNSTSVSVGTSEDGEINEEYVLSRLSAFKQKVVKKPEGKNIKTDETND